MNANHERGKLLETVFRWLRTGGHLAKPGVNESKRGVRREREMFPLFDPPDVGAVPVECAVERGPLLRARNYWLVNGVECVLEGGRLPRRTEGLPQFGRGTGTEDVDEREKREQGEERHSSAWLGLSGQRGPGLALAEGHTVHDESLGPRVVLDEGGIQLPIGRDEQG